MEDQTHAGADGHDTQAEVERADPIAGAFVTEVFEVDGGRQVTAYIPRHPPEAVVFAGDGQRIAQ